MKQCMLFLPSLYALASWSVFDASNYSGKGRCSIGAGDFQGYDASGLATYSDALLDDSELNMEMNFSRSWSFFGNGRVNFNIKQDYVELLKPMAYNWQINLAIAANNPTRFDYYSNSTFIGTKNSVTNYNLTSNANGFSGSCEDERCYFRIGGAGSMRGWFFRKQSDDSLFYTYFKIQTISKPNGQPQRGEQRCYAVLNPL